MSAFIIVQNLIVDAATMQAYIPKAIETLAAHGAEVLVASEHPTALEGTPPWPRTVVLRFPSREAAMPWYTSDAYQQHALPLRLSATTGCAILVDGFDPAGT